MSHKRVIRVISYEGIDTWVDRLLASSPLRLSKLRTFFHRHGTVSELLVIELDEDEELVGLDQLGKKKGGQKAP